MNHSTLGRDLMALFIEARDGDEQTVPRELGGFLGAGEEETSAGYLIDTGEPLSR